MPQPRLDDLVDRLGATRWPTQPVRSGGSDGVDRGLVRVLVGRWSESFDWRAREASLNRFEHRRVDGQGLFIHVAIAHGRVDRTPLLALHGWPSTFEQMTRIADLLSDAEHGVTVVMASLPGFGFSDSPTEPGWGPERMARALDFVMRQKLGHARYFVRATDYGIPIALHLGARFPTAVAGIHIGGTHLAAPQDVSNLADLTSDERQFIGQARAWYAGEGAYNQLQATKPETVAVALSDSPSGQLAWLVEKLVTWCVTADDVFATFSADDLLSTATIYWLGNTVASSLRLYREDHLAPGWPRVRVPLAINQPTDEEYFPPRSWWHRLQPVTRYTTLAGAAHFPEWEQPERLAADLVDFFDLSS